MSPTFLMLLLTLASTRGGRSVPKIELPKFGDLPSSKEVSSNSAAESELLDSKTSVNATYVIVSVQQERVLGRPVSVLPMSELTSKSEPFSSIIRLRASQKNKARIDVSLIDPRGSALVTHSGLVSFKHSPSNETDYVIRWETFSIPEPGTYQMKIELDGQEMGIWPLHFAVARK